MLYHSSSTLRTVFSNVVWDIVPGHMPSLNVKRATTKTRNNASIPWREKHKPKWWCSCGCWAESWSWSARSPQASLHLSDWLVALALSIDISVENFTCNNWEQKVAEKSLNTHLALPAKDSSTAVIWRAACLSVIPRDQTICAVACPFPPLRVASPAARWPFRKRHRVLISCRVFHWQWLAERCCPPVRSRYRRRAYSRRWCWLNFSAWQTRLFGCFRPRSSWWWFERCPLGLHLVLDRILPASRCFVRFFSSLVLVIPHQLSSKA